MDRMTHLIALLLAAWSTFVTADDNSATEREAFSGWFDSAYLQAGYALHWSDGEDRDGVPWLVGIELTNNDRHRVGISLFNNSFNQFSQYFYYGYKWKLPFVSESSYIKLTGGIIHGYVDEFENKIRPNFDGWAPVVIPTIGWKDGPLGLEIAVLGDAGIMLLIGRDVWMQTREAEARLPAEGQKISPVRHDR